MLIFRRIYSVYSFILFVLIFLVLFPAFAILIHVNNRQSLVFVLHRLWARLYYFASFIPLQRVFSDKIDIGQQYIFCPNHFSYLDIPAVSLNRFCPIFVGMSSLGKIPLFGYMYRNIHITVDRQKIKSKYNAFWKCAEALDRGQSVVIFPEGGIASKNPPEMGRFKDGAFRLAIEKQIPIVPITIPYNWIILPDNGKMHLKRHENMIIFHDPIETKGFDGDALDGLKSRVFGVIDRELKSRNSLIGI